MAQFSSGNHLNTDPHPWVGADGKRYKTEVDAIHGNRRNYSKQQPVEPTFEPRPEFGQPLSNPENPILRSIREYVGRTGFTVRYVAGRLLDELGSEDEHWTGEQIDHARRVLSRLVATPEPTIEGAL